MIKKGNFFFQKWWKTSSFYCQCSSLVFVRCEMLHSIACLLCSLLNSLDLVSIIIKLIQSKISCFFFSIELIKIFLCFWIAILLCWSQESVYAKVNCYLLLLFSIHFLGLSSIPGVIPENNSFICRVRREFLTKMVWILKEIKGWTE